MEKYGYWLDAGAITGGEAAGAGTTEGAACPAGARKGGNTGATLIGTSELFTGWPSFCVARIRS